MFYLTSKFHDNSVNTFEFIEGGGGGGGHLKPTPQARELPKSLGGIGLTLKLAGYFAKHIQARRGSLNPSPKNFETANN